MTAYALSLIPEFLRMGVGFLLHPTPLARIPTLRGRGELKEPLCSYVIMSKNVLMSKLKIREIRKIRVQFLFMQISLISQKKGYEFFRFYCSGTMSFGSIFQNLWF